MSRHRFAFWTLAALGTGALANLAAPIGKAAPAQVVTPPKARYAMDVGTMSGFAGGGMGGAMSMMMGRAPREMHEMHLRLGSTLSPDGGSPKADHLPPPGAKLGKSLPLITPQRTQGSDEVPDKFERPKGRLLVFWGCGANAPKGQPVIFDFAKMAAGQMPPGLFSARVPVDRGPNMANSRTYGDWPNAKSSKMPGGGSSLIGQHSVAGNYSPPITFALTKDWMPGINARSQSLPGGVTSLGWNSVAGATGYYAWVMGMKMDQSGNSGDMVWWSSSSAREFGGGLSDWLSPGTVQRLIGEKVVMPPTQTSCSVPAEVKAAAPDMMMASLYAYGPEENFVHPPRPADPKVAWNQEWTARVRHRSMTTLMAAGGMAGMGGGGQAMAGEDGEGGAAGQPPKKKCKGGLGGLLGAATGTGC